MEFRKAKRAVIITEAILLDKIIEMITELGADGYTVQSATGKGERGVRSGNSLNDLLRNVRIETITSEEVANKIAVEVLERFFKNYAGIFYMDDVEIVRAKKFHLPE